MEYFKIEGEKEGGQGVEPSKGRRFRNTPPKKELLEDQKKPDGSKGLLRKLSISWIFSISLVILIISLYAFHSGKSDSPRPIESSTPLAGFQSQRLDAVSIAKEYIPSNSIPGAGQNQNTEPENVNLSLDDTIQKASRALVFLKAAQGSGCGFLLSNKGIIITNAHILGKGNEAEIFFPSGAEKRGVVLKKLPLPLDIAFLQIDGDDFETLPLADSDQCQEGEEVIALGFSGGGNWGSPPVPSKGSIRNCNLSYEGVQYQEMDRAVNQGNDGGPIINKKGEVIGLSKGEFSIKDLKGAGYGMAINVVKASMDQKLFHLEEKIRERETFFKYVYDDLWIILSSEYQVYQKKLYEMHMEGAISAQEAEQLEKRSSIPPAGYPSLKNWVADLSEKVIKGELTKEKAISILKGHFAQ